MKNRVIGFFAVVLVAFGLGGCQEDSALLPANTQELYQFRTSRTEFAVTPSTQVLKVPFGVTNISSEDRTIPLIVDATSTATAEQYSVPASVVIPAGQTNVDIPVTVNFDVLPADGQEFSLIIRIDTEVYQTLEDRSFHKIDFFRYCGTESLAGVHSYRQYDMIKGPSTPFDGEITGQMAFIETTTGTYNIADLSWGHFPAVWSDNPANNGSAVLKWTCSGLLPFGNDQYGDTYTYNIISVEGSKLTFRWENTYGDAGTVEVTRAGGANWPAGL